MLDGHSLCPPPVSGPDIDSMRKCKAVDLMRHQAIVTWTRHEEERGGGGNRARSREVFHRDKAPSNPSNYIVEEFEAKPRR